MKQFKVKASFYPANVGFILRFPVKGISKCFKCEGRSQKVFFSEDFKTLLKSIPSLATDDERLFNK